MQLKIKMRAPLRQMNDEAMFSAKFFNNYYDGGTGFDHSFDGVSRYFRPEFININ